VLRDAAGRLFVSFDQRLTLFGELSVASYLQFLKLLFEV